MNGIFKKLNLKDQKTLVVLNAPDSFSTHYQDLDPDVKIVTQVADEGIRFLIHVVTQQHEIEDSINQLASLLDGDAIIWYCYPKKSSKNYTTDISRDNGWDAMGRHGLEPVRQVAIDEDWSALRFRKVDYIKKMTRSFAMTEEGKKKAGQ